MNDPHCIIRVSEDKLNATLSLRQKDDDVTGCPLNAADVQALLARLGIINGVDAGSIDEAVTYLRKHPESTRNFHVATARPATAQGSPVNLLFSEQQFTYEQQNKDGTITPHSFTLTPMVPAGARLAIPHTDQHAEMEKDVFGNNAAAPPVGSAIRIRAGENVEFQKKSRFFTAAFAGYPATKRTLDNGIDFLEISVNRLFQVSPDAMSATLALRPSLPDKSPPDFETLLAILDEERIVFGRLNKQIQTCIDAVAEQQKPKAVTVAMGIRPQNGTDAKLRFEIEVGPLPGKIRGDGSIDFRERKMFVAVSEGELIAVKVPQTAGVAGRDVHGVEIPQKPGKDLNLKVSDDAVFDPQTGEVRAARSGVLSMVTENSVKVCSKQVIAGDVDYKTGNIISRDTLEISGSVQPQFKVVAFGDITIGGNVEKAILRSDANIIIKGGIIGQRSRVQARGDVDIRFLERGRVFARGNIMLRKSGYYCRLHTWKDCFCPPEVKIIASQVVAGGSLTLGDVGAENADPAILAAGVDPERLQLYYDYRRARDEKRALFDRKRQLVGADSENVAFLEVKQELQWAEDALRTLNMIPDTQLGENPQGMTQLPQNEIIVHGTIHGGTELRIGNTTTVLEATVSRVRFHLAYKQTGRYRPQPTIVSTPLETE